MSLLTPLFWMLIMSPLFIIAWFTSKKGEIKYLLYFILYILGNIYIQMITRHFITPELIGLKWPWAGMILSLLFSLTIVFLSSKESRQEMGFTTMVNKKTVKFGVLLFLGFLLFDFIFKMILFPKGGKFDFETFAFQAIMPGLTEEITFRGIGLWLLSKVYLPKWKWRGIDFGWDFIIVTVFFAVGHGAVIDENLKIKFDIVTILYLMLISSLSLGFLRKFSGSLLYSTIGHNTINLMNAIIRIL